MSLFLLTVCPVEMWWAEAEVWLIRALPVVMTLGLAACMMRKRLPRVNLADCLVMVWWAAEALRYYAGYGNFTVMAFYGFSESVLLYIAMRLLFAMKPSDDRLIVVCLLCGCVYEAWVGFGQLAGSLGRGIGGNVIGTFLNSGPYSAYLAVGLSVAMACVKTEKLSCFSADRPAYDRITLWRRLLPERCAAMVAVAAAVVMLSLTWSRAALVAVGGVAVWLYHDELRHNRYRYVLAAVVAALLVAAYLLKSGSADGRLLMWCGSLSAWCDAPWFGAGIGGFSQAYASGVTSFFKAHPDTLLLRSADVTDNAFCELLTIVVEQGVVGAAVFVVLLGLVFSRLRRRSVPLMCALAALVIFSMFSYPFHQLPYRIIFVVICAWAVSGDTDASDGRGRHRYTVWVATVAVTLPVCLLMRHTATLRMTAARDYRLLGGVDAVYVLKDYYDMLPLLDDNPYFLFSFGKALHSKARYNDSLYMLRLGRKVSADPMFSVLMGNNYRCMGLPGEAERCYKEAFDMMPNRIYPLYRLMLLYNEQGRHDACRRMAKRVVMFREKVTSEATQEMKREAARLYGD